MGGTRPRPFLGPVIVAYLGPVDVVGSGAKTTQARVTNAAAAEPGGDDGPFPTSPHTSRYSAAGARQLDARQGRT